jgi:protein ImuA
MGCFVEQNYCINKQYSALKPLRTTMPAALTRPAMRDLPDLPPSVAAALWRGHALGGGPAHTVPSGHALLDAVLPGGGWPCQALTEILSPQPALCEWRLLGPGLRALAERAGPVVLVGPPRDPHLPGLLQAGLRARDLVWIDARTVAERLWAAEQVLQSRPDSGALLVWLPQARAVALRRLQVRAQTCACPIFLFRPDSAAHEASPAPLRVAVLPAADWQLRVRLLKRRGPALDGALDLPAVPAGLARVLTPRLLRVGALPLEGNSHADTLVRPAVPGHRSDLWPVHH